MKIFFLSTMMVIFLLSCKKNTISTSPVCKLKHMVSRLGVYDFTYDTSGNISKYSNTTNQGSDVVQIIYTLQYDNNGYLTTGTQTAIINGQTQNEIAINFTYKNGKLAGLSYYPSGGTTAFAETTIVYDAHNRINRMDYVHGSYKLTDTYEYDSKGNCTKHTYADTDGYKDELIQTFDNNKNPDQLVSKIIPFEFGTNTPWNLNLMLNSTETFTDPSVATPLVTTAQHTNIKTDGNGYVTSADYTDSNAVTSKDTYSFSDCN